ncbi:unnamed protein product [Closterium sp. NIES-54]
MSSRPRPLAPDPATPLCPLFLPLPPIPQNTPPAPPPQPQPATSTASAPCSSNSSPPTHPCPPVSPFPPPRSSHPPEYSAGPTPPTPAGDVYSFGVVLLELLTARPPVDPAFTDNGTGDLIGWVRATIQAGQPGEALDPRMADAAESGDEMLQFLKVALVCVAEDGDERPMMREVVEMMVRARETAAKIRENPQIRDLLE